MSDNPELESNSITVVDESGEKLPLINPGNVNTLPPSHYQKMWDEFDNFYYVFSEISPEAAKMFGCFTFNLGMIALSAGLQISSNSEQQSAAIGFAVAAFTFLVGFGAIPLPVGVCNQIAANWATYQTLRKEQESLSDANIQIDVEPVNADLASIEPVSDDSVNADPESLEERIENAKACFETVFNFGLYANLGFGVISAMVCYTIGYLLPYAGQDPLTSEHIRYILQRLAPALIGLSLRSPLEQPFFSTGKSGLVAMTTLPSFFLCLDLSTLLCWFGIHLGAIQIPALGEPGFLSGFVLDAWLSTSLILILLKFNKDWHDFTFFTPSYNKMVQHAESIKSAIELAKTSAFSFGIELTASLMMTFIAGLHSNAAQEAMAYHALFLSIMLPLTASFSIMSGIIANQAQSASQTFFGDKNVNQAAEQYQFLYNIMYYGPLNNVLCLGFIPIAYALFATNFAKAIGNPSAPALFEINQSARIIALGAFSDILGYDFLTILRQTCPEYAALFSKTNAVTLGSISAGIALMFLLGLWPKLGLSGDRGIAIGYCIGFMSRAIGLLPFFVSKLTEVKRNLIQARDPSSDIANMTNTQVSELEVEIPLEFYDPAPQTPRRDASQSSSSSLFSFFSQARETTMNAVTNLGERVCNCVCPAI